LPARPTEALLAAFAVLQQIISHRPPFLAETHDRQRFDDQKNSKTPAVLPLFSAVLGQHAPIAQMTAVAQKVS
jgi:hypothetical protein